MEMERKQLISSGKRQAVLFIVEALSVVYLVSVV